ITIRTSLIVGFPGETEEQFQALKQFLIDTPLDQVGVFRFSQEEGSHAATLPNQIDAATKERRWEELMQVQQEIVAKRLTRYVGQTVEAFVEGYHPESDLLMVARHSGQCPDIDNCILINDGHNVTEFGKRYQVKITDVAGIDLVGTVL
ncbi:MAG: TRAM domain-containing protein, partial [Chlamydiia bacterium]|nr:TRAM domain-containing protein [Chlamydiia bacterium]